VTEYQTCLKHSNKVTESYKTVRSAQLANTKSASSSESDAPPSLVIENSVLGLVR
jgi:hypothetical protein